MSGPAEPAGERRDRTDEFDDLAFGEDAPLLQVMRTMRAMRRLKPDPVDPALLEQLVEAATWAPSGSNVQAYSYVVVTDREQMRRLAEPWRACSDFYWRIGVPPPNGDPAKYERMKRAGQYQAAHFHETPAVIVACYQLGPWERQIMRRVGPMSRALVAAGPRRVASLALRGQRASSLAAAASVYPGMQNLLLTARALGLAAVLTTWHVFYENEFKAILGIPRDVQTFAIIPVGWPKGTFGPVVRQPAVTVIHRDRWSPVGGG